MECRQLLGGVILSRSSLQWVIGRHSWVKFSLGVPMQNHNTTKFLSQIAARTVNYTGKVPKGSRGVPPLIVLLQVMTKRDQFVTSKKKGENCIRVNGGCAILRLLLDHLF